MGKRISVDVLERSPQGIEAQYSRETTVGPQYRHRRKVTTTQSGWEIVDSVRSDEPDEFTVRYHFHPSTNVHKSSEPDREFVARADELELARFGFTGATEHRLVHTSYFERFGQERERQSIEVTAATGTEVRTRVDGSATR